MNHITILDKVFASYRGQRVQVVCLFTDGGIRKAECYRAGDEDDSITVLLTELTLV